MKVAIKASNNKFITAEQGGDSVLVANRDYTDISQLGYWEQFTLHVFDDRLHVAIQSYNGKFLSAEEGGGHGLSCNRTNVGAWELFKVGTDNSLQCIDEVHYVTRDLHDQLDCQSIKPEAMIPVVLEADHLPRIHVDGLDFKFESGQRHVIKGCTDLMLAWKYDTSGEAAAAEIMSERHQLGFNNLRVLWQKDIGNTGHNPWQMPLDKLAPFLLLAEQHGLYIQGTILADCQVINPSVGDQQERVSRVRVATTGINNNIEQLGNEYDKNGHDPRNFSRPADRLAANSSSTEGGNDAKPYWDFFCFSGQRSPINHAVREYGPLEFMYGNGSWGGIPAICDEGFKPGINSSNPRDFERAGAQARSGCGGRFHTDAGTAGSSRLFNDIERESAAAFIQGIG